MEKELIERLKKSKELMKKTINYKSNNLDYKVGMLHGFEFIMDELEEDLKS